MQLYIMRCKEVRDEEKLKFIVFVVHIFLLLQTGLNPTSS